MAKKGAPFGNKNAVGNHSGMSKAEVSKANAASFYKQMIATGKASPLKLYHIDKKGKWS